MALERCDGITPFDSFELDIVLESKGEELLENENVLTAYLRV